MSDVARLDVILSAEDMVALNKLQAFDKKLADVGKTMSDIGGKMSMFVTVPVVAGFTAMFNSASDFNESINKVDVSFGDNADEVKAWAKTTLKSFGIAEGSALDMAALFGDMGTSMGLTNQEASNMSTNMVGLAGDLASFKNVQLDVAKTALAGIFTGETESLKKLGIVMTEANLEQFALTQGYEKSYKELSQAEKVQLRYAYVTAMSKNAVGDFARTSDSSANATRTMQESIKEASASFGQALLPIITPLIIKLTELAQWFGSLDEGTKSLIIGVGLFAAGVGPLLTVLGTLATLVSGAIALYAGFTAAIAGNTLAVGASKIAVLSYNLTQGAMAVVTKISTAATWLLNAAMAALPFVWVAAAIAAVIAIGYLLVKNWDSISAAAGKVWAWVTEAFSNMFNAIKNAFIKFNIFSLLNDYIIKPFFKIDLFEIGRNVIQGFLDGAGSLFRNIGKFFIDLLPGWIVAPFKLALGIKSPSKVFAGFGENIGQGLINGMDKSMSMVEDASLGLANVSMGNFGDMGDVIVEAPNQRIVVENHIQLGSQHIVQLTEDINNESRRLGKSLIEV